MRISLPLLTIISILFFTSAEAQNWKWAKSISATPGIITYPSNTGTNWNTDLSTDPAGNVYLLAVGGSNFQIDGSAKSGYGNNDILLSSFSCDGVLRWSKVIGSASDSDLAYSVKADATGGVYMTAEMHVGNNNFDVDTSVGATLRTMYLVKWDTAGRFQWLRMPQPASIGYTEASVESQLIDLSVDEQGNSHMLVYLAPATYGGSYNVSTPGMHILRYGASGQFLGGFAVPITFSVGKFLKLLREFRLSYVPGANRYIIKGYCQIISSPSFTPGIVSVGGTALPQGSSFVTSINAITGAVVWLKYGTNYQVRIANRPQVDLGGNVYIAGSADSSATLGLPVFNGATLSHGPFAMKLNASSGAAMWTVSGKSSSKTGAKPASLFFALGIAGNRVLLGGQFVDTLTFATHQLKSSYITDSVEAFLLVLDSTSGSIQQATKLSGGDGPKVSLIVPGKKYNFYVAGNVGSKPIQIGATTVQNPAASTGFFLAKWGYNNCQCVLPAPSFTSTTISATAARYTYTGTTGGIDSLVWEWGDGARQKVTTGFTTPITHTYASKGKYNVCVTAYNDTCGENRYCGQTALSVGSQINQRLVNVYPNPASDQIFIEGAKGSRITILNVTGQSLIKAEISSEKHIVSLGDLPKGVYMLRVDSLGFEPQTIRFTKL